MRKRAADIALAQTHPAEEGDYLGTAGVVVFGLEERLLAESRGGWKIRSLQQGKSEQSVRALRAAGHLREELLENHARPVAVPCEPVEVRRREPAASSLG